MSHFVVSPKGFVASRPILEWAVIWKNHKIILWVSDLVRYKPVYNKIKLQEHKTTLYCSLESIKVRKRAKIRNRYNQAPHLTQDTNGKVTTSQLDITNESQEVSPFPAGDHKASTNRRA